jgi:phage shock protein B
MDDNLSTLLFFVIVVLGPIWITLHYKYKIRAGNHLNATETAMLAQITATAQRMEQRIATLERILDSEIPNWRGNASPDGMYNRRVG